MSDHESGLPLLPRIANQGRTEDIHPQERQQDRESGAPVDPLLSSPTAILRLKNSRISQRRGQGAIEITASFREARKR